MVDEICNIINNADSSNNCILTSYVNFATMYTNVPEWLYSTNYWTITPYVSNPDAVYSVSPPGTIGPYSACNDNPDGVRPVIATLKSNIK